MGTEADAAPLLQSPGWSRALLCPRLPGHGDPAADAMELPELLAELAELARGCEAAAGYSMGGRLLMMAALAHPDAFSRLIVESAFLGPQSAQERLERRERECARAQRLREEGLQRFSEHWYDAPMWAGFRPRQARMGDASALASALECFGSYRQPDLRPWLKTLRKPLLWICGEQDLLYREQADWVAKHSDARLAILPAGHNVHAALPEAWAEAVTSFLPPVSQTLLHLEPRKQEQ